MICFDNLLTGKAENIKGLMGKSNFRFVEGDIRNFELCCQLTEGVDAVSHQAALGSVPRSIENPIPTNEINCHGFLNMLTAAKQNGVKRFVYASSSSVYGDATESPKMEDKIGRPLSPYAVSKLTNELYGKVFFDLYGMQTIGLRYFNVFGTNQDPNGAYAAAIPKFLDLLKNRKSPMVYGDGTQTRDFTYVKNVIRANELALSTSNTESFGQVYNVACGDSFSLLDVIQFIKEELVKKDQTIDAVHPVFLEKRKGDIADSLADISKIKSHLGYEPLYSFREGIQEYIHSNFSI